MFDEPFGVFPGSNGVAVVVPPVRANCPNNIKEEEEENTKLPLVSFSSSFLYPADIIILTIDDVVYVGKDERRGREEESRERAWICSSSKDKQKWLIDWEIPSSSSFTTTTTTPQTIKCSSCPLVCFSDFFVIDVASWTRGLSETRPVFFRRRSIVWERKSKRRTTSAVS